MRGADAVTIDQRRYLFLVRNSDLGSVGRCGSAQICNIVGNGNIGLMADCGDHRNFGCKNGSRNRFVVKTPEILRRPASPARNNQIGKGMVVNQLYGFCDLSRSFRSLYPDRDN